MRGPRVRGRLDNGSAFAVLAGFERDVGGVIELVSAGAVSVGRAAARPWAALRLT